MTKKLVTPRETKIKLLQDILRGKKSIADLQPKSGTAWIGYGPDGGNLYTMNGEPCTKEEFNEWLAGYTGPCPVYTGDLLVDNE